MTDVWQLIDGFERLREEFLHDNPAWRPAAPQAVDGEEARRLVAEAWLRTRLPRLEGGAPQQRRLRMLVRALFEQEAAAPHAMTRRVGATAAQAVAENVGTQGLSAIEERLIEEAGDFPARLEKAAQRGLRPLAPGAGGREDGVTAGEVAAWRAVLPGLGGMRAWQFLERLGRPTVAADAQVRRMLWRLGRIEDASPGEEALVRCHSELMEIAGLTGLGPELLAGIARWHTRARSGWSGGGRCVDRPRCRECPLFRACAWVRFHPPAEHEPPAPGRPVRESARRAVANGEHGRLDDMRLLSLIVPGVQGRESLQVAEELLRRFGGLRGLDRASVAELAEVHGLSSGRAVMLKAALELGRRLAVQSLRPGDPVRRSEDVWHAYRARFRNLPQEHFLILMLDAKNRVIGDHVVSKGTLTGSLAHPREVFQQAVRHCAASVILMHNHPSGDPQPSRDDVEVTRRLRQAGEILGIHVLDHIILGADDYYSFKDEE